MISDEGVVLSPVQPADSTTSGSGSRRWEFVYHYALTHPRFLIGILIIMINLLFIMAAPWLAPYGPLDADPLAVLKSPSLEHPFGTDIAGMDILSRVIFAPRIDISIAIVSVLFSLIIGGALGMWSGYRSGIVGEIISRISDTLQTFPVFILAITLVAVTGQRISNVIWAVMIVNAPTYFRLLKGQTLYLKKHTYIEAAKCMGASDISIITYHIFPNAIGPALTQLSVNIGWAILLTAGLSFVGAGVRPPTPEWGAMIAVGAPNIMTGHWWPSVFPGLAITITVMGFAMVTDGIQALFNPRNR